MALRLCLSQTDHRDKQPSGFALRPFHAVITTVRVIITVRVITRSQAGWASITRGGVRSKTKRYRTDQNRNAYMTRSSAQHGFWALKIEAVSKTKIPNCVKVESIEPRPTLVMLAIQTQEDIQEFNTFRETRKHII